VRSCDPVTLLHLDISACRAQINIFQDTAWGEPQFPPVANELIGYNEENDDIALLRFAREKGNPVLVEFSGELSKAGERRLRQAAQWRNFKLRLFRLIDGWAIIEVHSKQTRRNLTQIF
jgi:hypothetical protein